MNYGSVCSGMEAATCAWHPLGWTPAFVSEIDPTASRLLAGLYPDVPNLGDMTKFQEWPDYAIDLLVGGTPCQSFSIAGLRKGLADPRGNLMLTYLAIVDRYRPRWLVWENVPGVLSSNGGRDFGTFLGGLGQLGYGFAYRVLDAQYVRVQSHPRAVPQRRRRVFVVGHLGDWRRAAAVLFERESLSRHPPPRRQAGKGTARGFETGPNGGGFTDLAPTMDARAKDGPIRNQLGVGVLEAGGKNQSVAANDVSPTLDAMMDRKWGSNQWVDNGFAILSSGQSNAEVRTDGGAPSLTCLHEAPIVAHSLRAEGFDASEDGTGRGTPIVPVAYRTAGDGAVFEEGDKTAPLTTGTDRSANIVAHAYDMRGREGGAQFEGPHDTANIRAAEGGSSRSYVASTVQVADTLGVGANQTTGFQSEVAAVQSNSWAVRRLTPTECLRLQGFPDDYFDRARLNKPLADGPKYKMLGNSMAVNVMSWIGQRIQMVEGIKP